MIQITEDLVLGARFTVDMNGGTLLRLFEVTGLTPGVDTLARAAAAQDGSSGAFIPRYGEAHPAVAGIFVNHIDAQPLKNSRTAARVLVRYAPPEAGAANSIRIAIVGSSRSKIISRNPGDGSLLNVRYSDPTGTVLQEFLQLPVLSPNTILEFTRQEIRSPLKLSTRFRRTVNAAPWQAGDARTWLCRAIDGNSLANGSRYQVKYVFEYDPDGWERIEYYADPYTGKIPDDIQFSTNNDHGVAKVLPYAVMDFAQLGLPNAF